MYMNFNHKDIEFEFEIENITIRNPYLIDGIKLDWENPHDDIESAKNMELMIEFTDRQSMHHFESIIREHIDNPKMQFHNENDELDEDKTLCSIPIECLNGLEIMIQG